MSIINKKKKKATKVKAAAPIRTVDQKPKPRGPELEEAQRLEKNALSQLAKFDKAFNDPSTIVRLDTATTSNDGKTKRRYIVMKNGRAKYEAQFLEKDKKQELVQVASFRATTKKS
jgi:hypothetical protein